MTLSRLTLLRKTMLTLRPPRVQVRVVEGEIKKKRRVIKIVTRLLRHRLNPGLQLPLPPLPAPPNRAALRLPQGSSAVRFPKKRRIGGAHKAFVYIAVKLVILTIFTDAISLSRLSNSPLRAPNNKPAAPSSPLSLRHPLSRETRPRLSRRRQPESAPRH